MNREHLLSVAALCVLTTLILPGCDYRTASPLRVPVRGYLYSDEAEPAGFGAYGYLLFTAQPSGNDLPRYQHVCEAFQRDLVEAWGNAPEDRTSQMATFWPLQIPQATAPKFFDCQNLVKNYDYRRASGIATAIKKQGARGPILTASAKPIAEANSSGALVLDLSDFADEDLDRAFAIWRERISTDPAAWRDGFNLVVCREAFRNFLQKYGDTVLAIVNPAKESKK